MSWYKKLVKPAIAALAIGSAGLGHAQELEKDELKFGFIKLTDMAPLAIAYEKLFFEEEGLFVTLEAQGRHDPCVLPRAVPMVEAMMCLVLVDHWLRQKNVDVLPALSE